jgi:acetyl-CoA C-acetyltransferase
VIDERLAVLIGGGQVTNRFRGLDDVVEPVALMAEALRRAAADADATGGLLAALERIVVVAGAWPYPDPGAIIADQVRASGAATALTHTGGDVPLTALGSLADAITHGDLDVGAIVGGESIYGRQKLRRAGRRLSSIRTHHAPAARLGTELDMSDPVADERGLDRPPHVYPLFESALRAHHGESHDDHRERVGGLWEGLNRTAVANEYAWTRSPMSAQAIITPSVANRMVAWPYTKVMNSNWFVDQGAAVIVCSMAAARRFGVAPERMVFMHSVASGHAPNRVLERLHLHDSPSIRETGRAALRLAGVGVDDVALLDLYSCFPSVVQITMSELGIDRSRPLTLTGGLTFAGGPLNNYVSHSLAAMIGAVRATGERALIHGNGGYATKQVFGVFGSQPPTEGLRVADVQPVLDRYPTRAFCPDHSGDAAIEASTVLYENDEPVRAIITAITPDGTRALGGSTDPAVMVELVTEPTENRRARFTTPTGVEIGPSGDGPETT